MEARCLRLLVGGKVLLCMVSFELELQIARALCLSGYYVLMIAAMITLFTFDDVSL